MIRSVVVLVLLAVSSKVALCITTVGNGYVAIAGEADVVSLDVAGVAGQTANLLTVADDGAANTMTFSTAGALAISGALSKGSGTFDIPHPLGGEHRRLRHSFVESPRADNVYSSVASLNASGFALVDLDAEFHMTKGTFAALNRLPRVIVSGNGCNAKWSIDGAALLLKGGDPPWFCQEGDEVTFLLIAERQDDVIKAAHFTDADGHVIPEYNRPPPTTKNNTTSFS